MQLLIVNHLLLLLLLFTFSSVAVYKTYHITIDWPCVGVCFFTLHSGKAITRSTKRIVINYYQTVLLMY